MDNDRKNTKEYYTIDILHVIRTVWYRIWIVVLVGIISAGIGFSIAAFAMTPKYSSSVMLYVNNSSFSLGSTSFSISSSEISAAQSLTKTYTVLLKNRTTLEMVLDDTGADYTWKELYGMIEASSVNETEVLKVTVTTEDPYESEKIANSIAKVLPRRISEIVEGSSMEVVDSGIANLEKVSPSITKYTAVGFVIGVLIAVLALAVYALMDNTIHDEDYILRNCDYPILAKVPDLIAGGAKDYGYYARKKVQ